MAWNKITTGFNLEDQTANFGTRVVAESDHGSVFEATTLATIQAEEEVAIKPSVAAVSYDKGGFCISVDKSLTVFSDERCVEIQLNVVFGSDIDAFTMSIDGTLLFVAVRDGDIHCLHIPSQGEARSSRNLLPIDQDMKITNLFCHYVSEDIFDLVIVSSNGQIHRIPQIDSTTLSHQIVDDLDVLNKILSDIQIEVVSEESSKRINTVDTVVHKEWKRELAYAGNGIGIMLADYKSLIEIYHMEPPINKVKKLKYFNNGSSLLVLTEDSKLSVVCPITLSCLKVWDSLSVQDFTLLPPSKQGQSQDLLMLTKSEDQTHSWLQLMSLPKFDTKLRLKVSLDCYLVTMLTDQQEILFVEGLTVGSMSITELHVKSLIESSPSDRYERILRRKKFDEAEKYARTFNLDIELVFKARARQYIEDLDPWTSTSKSCKTTMKNLIGVLDLIQDIEFVSLVCVNVALFELSFVRTLLAYANRRLKSENSKMLQKIRAQVCALEFRLETFELVSESSHFETWLDFSKADLYQKCRLLLHQGELRQASFIWTRHFCDFKHKLSADCMLELLRCLPVGISSVNLNLLRWLRHFIPAVLTAFPEVLEDVILWAIQISRTMELNKSGWPESGLVCSQGLLDLLKVGSSSEGKLSVFFQCSAPNSPLQQLITLIKSLKHLKTLKDDFNMCITLDDFMDENKAEVVALMLDNVDDKNVEKLITSFLKRFVEEWGLNEDQVLSDYVKKIVQYSGNEYDPSNEAQWACTVEIVLSHINNQDVLMDSILSLLKSAPVPWSVTLHRIAERGLKIKHPSTTEIKNHMELIPMKIVIKKYNFKRFAPEKCNHKICMSYIRHIIKMGSKDEMLQDCLHICRSEPKLLAETYVLFLEIWMKTDQEDRAFEYLTGLDKKMKEACIRKLMYKMTCNLKNPHFHLSPYCLERLDGIFNILHQSLPENTQNKFVPVDCLIQDVRKVCKMKMAFNCDISLKKCSSRSQYNTVLKNCTQSILMKNDSNALSLAYTLANLLQCLPGKGAVEYIKQATELQFVEEALKISENLDDLNDISEPVKDELLLVANHMMQRDDQIYKVAPVVQELSRNVILQCNNDSLLSWLHLFKWSSAVLRLKNYWIPNDASYGLSTVPVDRLNKWSFSTFYFDQAVCSDKSMAVGVLKEIFQQDICEKILQMKDLLFVMNTLQEENLDLLVLTLLQSAVISFFDQGDSIKKMWFECVETLLQKLVSSRKLDINLGLCLLSSVPQTDAFQWLHKMEELFSRDINKVEAVANLGMIMHNNIPDPETSHFEYLHKQCIWAKRFMKLGLPINEVFNKSLKPAVVLQNLLKVAEVSVQMISEFCADFELNAQKYFLSYLQHVILRWEPRFSIVGDLRKEIVVENEEDVVKKARSIVIMIENKNEVFSTLEQTLNLINYYNYEVYLAVYNLLQSTAPKKSTHFRNQHTILLFLKSYTRVMSAQKTEKEAWNEAFPDTKSLPAIAEWRLPFHQFLAKDVWSVVKLEVNLDTYETWLETAPIIGLDNDAICSVAIRQSISSVPLHTSAKKWNLHTKDSLMVDKISRCVDKLTSQENASAALFFVVNNTPPGADQVRIAHLCYMHAKKWARDQHEPTVLKCFAKVKNKFLDLATCQVLHSNGLGYPQYLQLTLKPIHLIRALYNDPSVVARGKEAAMHYPSINEAVDEISTIHGVMAEKTRIDLLEECLIPSVAFMGTTDDTTEVLSPLMSESTMVDNKLLQACYILEVVNPSVSANYLISFAFNRSSKESAATKLRALKCISSIASETALEDLTGRSPESIRSLMQCLHYIVELANLGVSYSITGFESCNKLELIKMIWHSQLNNPMAVSLMAQLCVDFNLFEIELWDSILVQMAKLKMMTRLEHVLPILAEHSHILNSSGYISAWNYVLITPFCKANSPITESQEKLCLQKLCLLQSCPILANVDLPSIIDHCIRSSCLHLGATLLPFLHGDLREQYRRKIVENCNSSNNMVQRLKTGDFGELLAVAKAIQILEEPVLTNGF